MNEPMDDNYRYVEKLNQVIDRVNDINENLSFMDRLWTEINERGFWNLIFAVFFTQFLRKYPGWKKRPLTHMDIPPVALPVRVGDKFDINKVTREQRNGKSAIHK
jgi:hypothetical protein